MATIDGRARCAAILVVSNRGRRRRGDTTIGGRVGMARGGEGGEGGEARTPVLKSPAKIECIEGSVGRRIKLPPK